MLWAWIHNIPLTKYLISQVLQSKEDRLQSLREYMPSARLEDWQLEEAWYRVQIIKEDKKKWGILQFGTEVIISEDKTLSTLLWASPWASTAVSIMLEIVEKCFPDYKSCLPDLIPSYGKKLSKDHDLLNKIRDWSHKILQLH
jgi:malate dehydrogenase (quinone)